MQRDSSGQRKRCICKVTVPRLAQYQKSLNESYVWAQIYLSSYMYMYMMESYSQGWNASSWCIIAQVSAPLPGIVRALLCHYSNKRSPTCTLYPSFPSRSTTAKPWEHPGLLAAADYHPHRAAKARRNNRRQPDRDGPHRFPKVKRHCELTPPVAWQHAWIVR